MENKDKRKQLKDEDLEKVNGGGFFSELWAKIKGISAKTTNVNALRVENTGKNNDNDPNNVP